MWMISRHSLAWTPDLDEAGFFGGVKMTGDGVANNGFEFVEGIGFCENGKAQGAGLKAAFGRFFDGKDDFGWGHVWAVSNDYMSKIAERPVWNV